MPTKRTAKSVKNLHIAAADSRKEKILHYARKLIIKQGYAHASLNEIIRHSGGSKATIAKYFTNKAGLFAAVFEDISSQFIKDLHIAQMTGPPDQGLRKLGEAILKFYLRPDALSAYRGLISVGYRNKQMANGFYRGGHTLIVHAIALRLKQWHAEGLIQCDDPEGDADRFTHILRSGLYEQILLGLRDPNPAAPEIAEYVRASVRVFLGALKR